MIFNNPARHNAVSLDMWEAVPQIMDDFSATTRSASSSLTGAGGKAFVSGADISKFEDKRAARRPSPHYEAKMPKARWCASRTCRSRRSR